MKPLLLSLLTVLSMGTLAAAERVALVIGNSAYPGVQAGDNRKDILRFAPLDTSAKLDAPLVQGTLAAAGFQVTLLTDL
ncbi:MAG: hypothetical protein ACOYMN_00690, partial [Roseimicrobium sp.]